MTSDPEHGAYEWVLNRLLSSCWSMEGHQFSRPVMRSRPRVSTGLP